MVLPGGETCCCQHVAGQLEVCSSFTVFEAVERVSRASGDAGKASGKPGGGVGVQPLKATSSVCPEI